LVSNLVEFVKGVVESWNAKLECVHGYSPKMFLR
jgi:hypothetical protein